MRRRNCFQAPCMHMHPRALAHHPGAPRCRKPRLSGPDLTSSFPGRLAAATSATTGKTPAVVLLLSGTCARAGRVGRRTEAPAKQQLWRAAGPRSPLPAAPCPAGMAHAAKATVPARKPGGTARSSARRCLVCRSDRTWCSQPTLLPPSFRLTGPWRRARTQGAAPGAARGTPGRWSSGRPAAPPVTCRKRRGERVCRLGGKGARPRGGATTSQSTPPS
eukprot:SAG22_NODE_51_length_24458_cov_19.853161_5_plen_219_part_00